MQRSRVEYNELEKWAETKFSPWRLATIDAGRARCGATRGEFLGLLIDAAVARYVRAGEAEPKERSLAEALELLRSRAHETMPPAPARMLGMLVDKYLGRKLDVEPEVWVDFG
jgi:hypothetical protein